MPVGTLSLKIASTNLGTISSLGNACKDPLTSNNCGNSKLYSSRIICAPIASGSGLESLIIEPYSDFNPIPKSSSGTYSHSPSSSIGFNSISLTSLLTNQCM